MLSHIEKKCKLNSNKRESRLTKKQIFFVLIFLNLVILILGIVIIQITLLDESQSLFRKYLLECMKDKDSPFISYGEYLLRIYKNNIFESLILISIIWAVLTFFIDIIDDLVNFRNLKK